MSWEINKSFIFRVLAFVSPLKQRMAMYLLYESSSGYGLFEAHGLDEIGQNTEAVRSSVTDLSRFGRVVQLTAFHPFESALDALNQVNAVSEGIYIYVVVFLRTRTITLLCFFLDLKHKW